MNKREISLKENMIWNSFGSMFYLGCQWLISILVVRIGGDLEAAGVLALGMAVSNIFTPVGYYKIRPFQVSDTRETYSFAQYLSFRVVTLGLSMIIMVVYGIATCDQADLLPVYLYGIYSMGPILVDVFHGEDQKRLRMDIIGKSLIARGALSIASFSFVLNSTSSLSFSLIAMTTTTFLVIFLYDWPATRSLGTTISFDFSKSAMSKLMVECAPAVLAAFICSAIPSIPRQVLETLEGSEVLGIYASIASPVLIIQMGAQYIYSPLLGVFAEKLFNGNIPGFLALLKRVTASIVAVTVAGLIFFYLFGEIGLRILFGETISLYSALLAPLCICSSLTAYTWFLSDMLIVLRDIKGNLIGYAVSFIICICAMTPLISNYSMNGATISVILAYIAGVVFFLIRITKCIKQVKINR